MMEYELEELKWKRRQLVLQEKYGDTPPGLTSQQVQMEEKRLSKAEQEYEEYHRFRLADSGPVPGEPFAGRRQELDDIRHGFAEGAKTIFLSGMGGIGKSALARTYGRICAQNYDHILIWEYDKSLEQIFADDGQLAITNMRYNQSQYLSRRKYASMKYEKLLSVAESKRILIILDNYNRLEESELAEMEQISCDVLVTTRLSSEFLMGKGYHVIPVEPFSEEEDWREFYRIYTGKEPEDREWEDMKAYRTTVKGHTLKMKIALSDTGQRWTDTQLAKSLLANYRLKKSQIQILCEMTYLTLQGIPQEAYLACTGEGEEDLEQLKAWSLVQERKTSSGQIFLSLHPVIAEAVRVTWQPTLTRCLKFVEKFSFYSSLSWYRPREKDMWLMPQVLYLLEHIPKPVAWRYYLYERLATYFMVWECYDEAERLLMPLYECVKQYYGENHQFTAFLAFRLASCYHNSMQFAKSRVWYLEAAGLYKTAKPSSSIFYHDKAEVCSRVARFYEYEERYEEAHRWVDAGMEAMEEFRQATEKADPELWKFRRNRLSYLYMRRATLYLKTGDLETAQQVLDTGMNLFPLDEFRKVEICRLQARIDLAAGKYEKAKAEAERDLELCIRYQGESYKMSLTCREVLGDICRAMGDITAANDAYLRVLVILQEKFPNQTEWMERLRAKM